MSFRRIALFSLALCLSCLVVSSSFGAEDEHAEGHVAAETQPHDESGGAEPAHGDVAHSDDSHGGDSHGDDSHGGDSHGAGAHHDPYADTLHANAGPNQENPAEWKAELAIWTLVVFGLLTAILWKFAWGPICDALDARERSVQQNIDAAKEQNEKAAALLADHEARLAGTADEVRRILEDARRDAETQKQGILAEAEAAAEAQKSRAIQEIDAAKNGALQELAEKSVDTAVGLAGKIVQRQLSAEDHSSLISEAIKHFPSKN